MTTYLRYRDFFNSLEIDAEGDDTARIVDAAMSRMSATPGYACGRVRTAVWHSCVLDRDIHPRRRQMSPSGIDPTVSMPALAVVLANTEMMSAARSILTPGSAEPVAAMMFTEGLKDLRMNPYPETVEAPRAPLRPIRKPPSLETALWNRIPRDQPKAYIKKMAHALVRGVHPDNTATELLAAA